MFISDFDAIVILTLDKRAKEGETLELRKSIRLRKVMAKTFLVGGGKLYDKSDYNYVDSPEPPPRLPDSTDYPTWWKNPASFNAFKCFQTIVHWAKESGKQKLLLLEDDAYLTDDFDDVLASASQSLPEQWDILQFGGFHNAGTTTEVGDNLLRISSGSYGWHAIALNNHNDIFDRVLDLAPKGPIDSVAAKELYPNCHAYAVWPGIIWQKDGFSYVEGCKLTKPSRFNR